MQEFAKQFYKSKAWRHCRDEYAKSVGHLCEKCLKKGMIVPGIIVHHKEHITPGNINNPNVTLNWDNLELVCRDCHAEEHPEIYKSKKRYAVTKNGDIIIKNK